MLIKGLDHVQLAMPRGEEEAARRFYSGVLGLSEVTKPVELQTRGGCWFEGGGIQVHLGVEEPFAPALKAHPGFLVDDLEAARVALTSSGSVVVLDTSGVDAGRFHLSDCFGNRLELIQDGEGFSQGKELVKARFGAFAQQYVTSRVHAEGDDLRLLLEVVRPNGGERMLDVATGGGHTALHFAAHVREVVATDLTPRMLAAAEEHLRHAGASNVSFRLADAEALPFPDADFDLITCRIAPHHFQHPARFVSEAARVLRPGGLFVLDDNMAPEDSELEAFLNDFERQRDPSHVASHPISRWRAWAEEAGLEVETATELAEKVYEFESWTARQGMAAEEKAALELSILSGTERCRDYFRVTTGPDGRLASLSARFGILSARKPSRGGGSV